MMSGTSKLLWADMAIRSPMGLQALIRKLKEAVASGELQQFWPAGFYMVFSSNGRQQPPHIS